MVLPQVTRGSTTRTIAENTNHDDSCSINQLPVEVLSHIILFSFRPKDLIHLPTTNGAARVCLLWRTIITESPQFWTSITNQSTEGNIRLKLHKSANMSIDILYDGCSSRPAPGPLGMQADPFLKLITPYIDRWRSVSAKPPVQDFLAPLLTLVNAHNKHIPVTIKLPWRPKTRRLSMDSLPSYICNFRLEGSLPSWAQNYNYTLTTFELGGSLEKTGDSLLQALVKTIKACPSLTTLRVGPLGPSPSSNRFSKKTTSGGAMAPSLQRLELRGAHSGLFARFLKAVDMPKLSKLFIYSTNRSQLVDGVAASLTCDAGGRSLLRLVLDNTGCDSLSISIGRATTSEWIKMYGLSGGRSVLEVELLRKAGAVTRSMFKLNPVTVPVQLNLVGTLSGLVPLLRRMPTGFHLRYRPHLDTGWQGLVLSGEDATNLPPQWEHTLVPTKASPLSTFIKRCYAWFSTEMRYGDPVRERRLRDIELGFDTTR